MQCSLSWFGESRTWRSALWVFRTSRCKCRFNCLTSTTAPRRTSKGSTTSSSKESWKVGWQDPSNGYSVVVHDHQKFELKKVYPLYEFFKNNLTVKLHPEEKIKIRFSIDLTKNIHENQITSLSTRNFLHNYKKNFKFLKLRNIFKSETNWRFFEEFDFNFSRTMFGILQRLQHFFNRKAWRVDEF